jgi:hypothetical protein
MLRELWRFNIGTSLKGAPVVYAIGPKQYLTDLPRGELEGSLQPEIDWITLDPNLSKTFHGR